MAQPHPIDAGADTRIVRVFGQMRTELESRTEAVPRGESQRLLGFLSLHPGAHGREVLTDVLWPDSGSRSRRILSDTLYRLRGRLGDGWIDAEGGSVALAAGVSVDVHVFDRLAASLDPADLEVAAGLHAEELLPAVYDDWAQEHRTARHLALLAALGRLAQHRERTGELDRALLDVRRMLAIAPLDESAHQAYLRLLGLLHRYGEAMAHYESLQQLLAEEVGVAPLPATADLVARLRDERDVAATADPPAARDAIVGRAGERAALLARVDQVLQCHGGIVCIEGVAGIGKSRLLEELVRSARWRGAVVVAGVVQDVPEASPLAPLAAALGPLLTTAMVVDVEASLDAEALRSLAPLHPAWSTGVEPSRPAGDGSARFRQAMRVLGGRLAAAGPLVVVLDDLHRASPTLWDALDALVEGIVPAGGLLAVAYRRPDVESSPGWPTLGSWDRQGLAMIVSLGPLEPADVAELLDGRTVEPEEVVALTGGIPFYVHEWLENAAVGRAGGGAAMVRQRLDALPPDERAVLEGAAILGTDIAFRSLVDITGLGPLELGARCERLVGARWLVATPGGHSFRHDLLRAVVHDDLPERRRRDLHGLAAASIARLAPSNARRRAYHLDHAGSTEAAVAAYREAGAASRAALAFDDARFAFGRALELLPRPRRRERLDVGLDLAEVVDVVGDDASQHGILEETVELAGALGDDHARLRGLVLLGGSAARRGDAVQGHRVLDQAARLAEQLGDLHGLADATYRRADLLAQSGRWEQAREQFAAALDLVDPTADRWLHGRVLRGLAIAAIRMGQPQEAVRRLEEAAAGYRAASDWLNELVTASLLAAAHYELSSWADAEAAAARARDLAQQLGDTVTYGIAVQHLALAALAVGERGRARTLTLEAEEAWTRAQRHRLVGLGINTRGLIAEDDGDHDEAIALYTAALEAARAVGAATEEAYAAHDLGALLGRLGSPDEAIGLLRAAVGHWAEIGNAALRAKSEAHLGLSLLASGSRAEAAALADAGMAAFRSGPISGEHPEAWLWALRQLLVGLGRAADADAVLAAAGAELRRQASAIPDPDRRRRFFEAVPLNRAIEAALASRVGPTSTIEVSLARVGAPLGRTLQPDERVAVRWTVRAADDDIVAHPAERRRHRLRRLLDEAAHAGAAPTDDDLARALGVSRRTVLRDMAVTGDAKSRTRRRARSASIGEDEP